MSDEQSPDWFTIQWDGTHVQMLDQRRLPLEEVYQSYSTVEGVATGIRDMVTRGAPAIGIAAGMGFALAAHQAGDSEDLSAVLARATKLLGATRPTAVNLFWALDRMNRCYDAVQASSREEIRRVLWAEANEILAQDVQICHMLGQHGAGLLPQKNRILTHCNAGALATGAYGTALAVIRAAVEAGKQVQVFADETRPYLQGARLTSWELNRDGIDVTVIADNAAGYFISRGDVDCVIVGSDRTVANGDVCNKIGTYTLAVLCKRHGIPFYAAVPVSTIDLSLASGDLIPIEERPAAEVENFAGRRTVPHGVPVRNPAFDVTPAELVTAIITEHGVAVPPFDQTLPQIVERSRSQAVETGSTSA